MIICFIMVLTKCTEARLVGKARWERSVCKVRDWPSYSKSKTTCGQMLSPLYGIALRLCIVGTVLPVSISCTYKKNIHWLSKNWWSFWELRCKYALLHLITILSAELSFDNRSNALNLVHCNNDDKIVCQSTTQSWCQHIPGPLWFLCFLS